MDGEKYSQTEIDSNNKKGYNLDFSENGVFLQVYPQGIMMKLYLN